MGADEVNELGQVREVGDDGVGEESAPPCPIGRAEGDGQPLEFIGGQDFGDDGVAVLFEMLVHPMAIR
jgi:hypothetical protein